MESSVEDAAEFILGDGYYVKGFGMNNIPIDRTFVIRSPVARRRDDDRRKSFDIDYSITCLERRVNMLARRRRGDRRFLKDIS